MKTISQLEIISNYDFKLLEFILSTLLFLISLFIFPIIFDTAGYMYSYDIKFDYYDFLWSFMTIFFTNFIISFQKFIYRVFLNTLNFGIIYPIFCLSSFSGYPITFGLVCTFSLWLTAILINLNLLNNLCKFLMNGRSNGLNFNFFEKISLPIYILITFLVYLTIGTAISNPLDIYLKAYDIREDLELSGILSYISGWPVIVLFPFAAYSVFKGRFLEILIWFVILIISYSALPLTFFPLLFCLLLFSAILIRYKPTKKYFIHLVFLSILLIGLFHPLLAMITNRAFYTIGSNAIFYFDFFSANQKFLFEGGFLEFGKNEYFLAPGNLIDNYYWSGLGTNQSVGYFPSIYANAGIFGVIIFTLISSMILLIISNSRAPDGYKILLITAFGFSLINISLNQLFFSNGLIVIIFALFFLSRTKEI